MLSIYMCNQGLYFLQIKSILENNKIVMGPILI